MDAIVTRSNNFRITRKMTQWVAALLLNVILVELVPSVWANNEDIHFTQQRTELSQLLKNLYVKFNESVQISDHHKQIDISLALEKFEQEFQNNHLKEEFIPSIISFINGVINLENPNNLDKTMVPILYSGLDSFFHSRLAPKEQLSLELPKDPVIKQLAKNLIQTWKLYQQINDTTSFRLEESLLIAAPIASNIQMLAGMLISIYSQKAKASSEHISDFQRKWIEFESNPALTLTQSYFIVATTLVSFVVMIGIVGHSIKWCSELNSRLTCSHAQKEIERLQANSQALIETQSAKYGIPHLKELISELVDSRALAQPAWNEELLCPICLEPYQTQESNSENLPITITRCAHKFHKSCLDELEESNIEHEVDFVCPICREALASSQDE